VYSSDIDVLHFRTYMLIAGIAGVNPYEGTLATAAFSRFAVQVALQYEMDARQMPANWTTGYWGAFQSTLVRLSKILTLSALAFGTKGPGIKPSTSDLYGTEVYELSTPLLARVMDLTKNVKLNDSATAIAYRSKFDYAPANLPPSVVQCDVATSDVYYAGTLLSESFGNFTKLMTNGTGKYCMTAQEDNATLESLVRGESPPPSQ
jgi:purine nucleoside permease